MVALAPVTPWIPKDDLLLKNAIEAGASLESLARGAVQFSRRFTIKELQDRWHTLLYEPVISAEASVRMVEFERSSKANKADNSKEAKRSHGKRKAESIRRCYYAMRRRICNEPLNQGDLSFLVAPGDNCFITGAEGPGPQSVLADPMQSHYGFEGANFDDLHHVFPEVMRDSALCGVGEFPSGQQNTLEDPIQQNILHKEVTQMDGGKLAMTGNCSATVQAGPSEELPGHDIFQANGLQANSMCDSKGIMCPGFGDINSSISECETSFHHLQYASSPPTMPDWKSNEGISVPEMPEDGSIRGNDLQPGDLFCVPGDGDAVNRTSEYDIHAESELNNHMSCPDLKDSTGCKEGYFAELSDSLFNFTSDDEMLMIDGGKDVIDKTYLGLSSLLLNSPDDLKEDTMPDMPELEEPAVVDEYDGVPLIAGLEDMNDAVGIHLEHFCDVNQINSESRVPTSEIPTSPATVNSEFPGIRDGVIWCTLNTEDPEIPSNDNLPLPSKPRPHSALRRTQSEANNPLFSGKDSSGTQTIMKREAKRSRESHTALHTTDLGATLNHSVDDFGVKFEASRGETHDLLRKPSSSQGGLAVKNEPSECPLIRQSHSAVLEKSGQVAAPGCAQTGCGGIDQEGQTMPTTRNQEFYALDSADPMAVEPGGEPLLSEDEQFSESDTDIPYFSDIESMILDMDLGPEGHDSFYDAEVAKYQHEDAKRIIIRLEQNAHSYIQRALVAHGAFAILYGRHSKHYIKKAEVLLGRGTDDVPVDIDLGREGRANKISRRQAIIKMEKDGTFILRNMGKCSIYVNSKEVFPGLTLGLHSNCLIEIRGMPFIFETNQASVKKFLDNTALRSVAKRVNV